MSDDAPAPAQAPESRPPRPRAGAAGSHAPASPSAPPRWRAVSGRLALEFAVIVVGVLVALWADSRMAARSEREVEAARLEALGAGIGATLEALRDHMEDTRRDAALLRRMLESGSAAGLPPDSVRTGVAIGLLGGTSAFHPRMETYEDLKSSGELSLLAADVRRALSAVDAGLRRIADAQADYTMVQQLNFDPFAMRSVDLASLLAEYLELEVPASASGDAQYPALLTTREFRNLVVFRLDLLENILESAAELEAALVEAEAAVGARLDGLR